MKTTFLLIILTLGLSVTAYTQSKNWIWQGENTGWSYPVKVSNDSITHIHFFFFADSMVGYMGATILVGRNHINNPLYNSHTFRTVDGGHTWKRLPLTGLPQALNWRGEDYWRSVPIPGSFFIGAQSAYFSYPEVKETIFNSVIYSLDTGNTWHILPYDKNMLRLSEYFVMHTVKQGKGIGLFPGTIDFGIVNTYTGPSGLSNNLIVGDEVFRSLMALNRKEDSPLPDYYKNPTYGEFSDIANGCFVLSDTAPGFTRGITTIVTTSGGTRWSKHNTIFPGYEDVDLNILGDAHFVKGTPNAWFVPFRNHFDNASLFNANIAAGGIMNTLVKEYPQFNISYCYTEDLGRTWKYDTTFFLRNSFTLGVDKGNVWMLLMNSVGGNGYYKGNYYIQPEVHILGHTTDYGKTWEVDTTSLRPQDFGTFDGRMLYFTDKSNGWMAAIGPDSKPWVFKYNAEKKLGIGKASGNPEEYSVTPNPASTSITIRYSEAIEIESVEVYDDLGRRVVGTSMDIQGNAVRIDTKPLASGVWTARITRRGGTTTARFIVEK